MKQIEIQSTITIVVTPNLKIEKLTDPNTNHSNKMRAKIDWDVKPVQITEGKGIYPIYVTEWETTKNLKDAGLFTFGEIFEEDEIKEDTTQATIQEMKKQMEIQKKQIEAMEKSVKAKPVEKAVEKPVEDKKGKGKKNEPTAEELARLEKELEDLENEEEFVEEDEFKL